MRLAFLYLRRCGDLAVAASAFRRDLRAFAAASGAPGKYHETLTWAWLVVIGARTRAEDRGSADLLARHPELLDARSGPVGRAYDLDALLADDHARSVFVLPGAP